ncbi:sialate O-acetylesterase [Mucilaginibacter terrae]|uniref:Sialate O-acetylesterase n=1 Tax=Mucilaginibacter terrae TaxID=1955052 RepID=A0ABU3GT00_9SPHI|nr:sialate O-acetylesterase [Mucilaginibacter terrae]MDT3402882.1 sialate O-acetylesterase [Mucilaginibacter terrae]
MIKQFTLALITLLICVTASAQIRLPKVIASNMVLQQKQPVPVWGWAKAGRTVKVTFGSQTKTATADTAGYWKVTLSSLKANDKPQDLLISSDTSNIKLTNILVGEVWLCSGQSNMEYTMRLMKNYTKPAKGIDSAELELTTNNPQIRLFKVEKKLSLPDVITTGWNECGGEALAQMSAAGYYFAKNLQAKLHVPIGIISSSWGGSRIEPWTAPSAYTVLPAFAKEAAQTPLMIDEVEPGKNYKSMIEPLAPFALHGFLWYQGESNCMLNEPGMRYADKMQALVDGWRKQWNQPKAPFYSVLIAPHYYTRRKDKVPHTPQTEAEFWEQQVQSTQIPNTALITITDLVDDLPNIHPSYKWEIGRRLSLLALAKDYGVKNLTYSGPMYKSMQVTDNKIVLKFTDAAGLKTSDGKAPDFFTIAGADGNYVEAKAEISGNTITLSSPQVAKPTTARFAWTEIARPNLVNGAGLPAVPFRTDGLKWEYKK